MSQEALSTRPHLHQNGTSPGGIAGLVCIGLIYPKPGPDFAWHARLAKQSCLCNVKHCSCNLQAHDNACMTTGTQMELQQLTVINQAELSGPPGGH